MGGSGSSSGWWSSSRWSLGSRTSPRSGGGRRGTSTPWRGRGRHTATRRSTCHPSRPKRRTSESNGLPINKLITLLLYKCNEFLLLSSQLTKNKISDYKKKKNPFKKKKKKKKKKS